MKRSCLLACVIAGLSTTALAQAPGAPVTPGTRLPLQYQSAFAGYRAYVDVEPIPWKRANDDAAAVGGPMGQMARDTNPAAAARPGAATGAPSTSAPTPAGAQGKPR
jgi:hypothetical protein